MSFDLIKILPTIGYFGIFAIVFAESGLLVGFFLPGDSLLFTAGFLASQGVFDIRVLVIGFFIAAVLGDNVGYWFGNKYGKRLFERNGRLFHKHRLVEAHAFFERHGNKAIVLARFVPAVRTFTPIAAGVGDMNYKRFVTYNVVGGLLWGVGMTTAGYFLGRSVPNADAYILPIVAVIIVVSLIPAVREYMRHRK